MITVSRKTFEARCAAGRWECEWEATAAGVAQVRDTASNSRFQVRVR